MGLGHNTKTLSKTLKILPSKMVVGGSKMSWLVQKSVEVSSLYLGDFVSTIKEMKDSIRLTVLLD